MPYIGSLPRDVVTLIFDILQREHGSRAALSLALTSRSHRQLYLSTHASFALPVSLSACRRALQAPLPRLCGLRSLQLSASALAASMCGEWESSWALLSSLRMLRLVENALLSPGAARTLRTILLGCRSLRTIALTPYGGALRWALAPCTATRLELVGGEFEGDPAPALACIAALQKTLETLRIELNTVSARGALQDVSQRAGKCEKLTCVELVDSNSHAIEGGRWPLGVKVVVEEGDFEAALSSVQRLWDSGVCKVIIRGGEISRFEDFLRAFWWDVVKVEVQQRDEMNSMCIEDDVRLGGNAVQNAVLRDRGGLGGWLEDVLRGFWFDVESILIREGERLRRDNQGKGFGRRKVRQIVDRVGVGVEVYADRASIIARRNLVAIWMRVGMGR